ncbi:D-alanyl-D-alanine carboxypeptidase/D-alanyl-D-alanine-endopeptidase [Arsenicicoccus dermatophilus]
MALATYGVADAHDVVPGILTIDPDPSALAATRPTEEQEDGGPVTPRVPLPTPVAATAARPARVPTTAGLAATLAPLVRDPRLGTVSLTVRDGATGAHLLDVAADVPRTPASTTKLLTAAAVVHELGPDARLTTATVLAPDGALVLRAGGDLLLGRGESRPGASEGQAGLGTLARQTAAALRARGITSVTLRYDPGVGGPDVAPTWDPSYLGEGIAGRVTSVGLADALVVPGAAATADPVADVTDVLREGLQDAGITVTGPLVRVAAGSTPAAATPLAGIRSATIADQLAVALDRSDNALTEALARQAAVHARAVPAARAEFAPVAAWVQASLPRLGYDVRGLRLADACGLSPGTLVPARLVGDLLTAGSTGRDPGLARVVADLPVAGLSGTLSERYVAGPARAGAGLVRAKTGTLTGTSSLAGTVVDVEGRTLAFAVLANDVPAATGTLGARDALDALATRLAACGCR